MKPHAELHDRPLAAPSVILVPIDFSPCSRQALDRAVAYAASVGATLHVLHVMTMQEVLPYHMVPGGEEAAGFQQHLVEKNREQARQLLDNAVKHCTEANVDIRVTLRESMSIAPAVLKEARAVQADWIVMGTHGRRGVKHWILGSVAEAVLREAPCPVLLVRQDDEAAPDVPPRRLLAPVDFSSPSMQALRLAAGIAAEHGCPLDVLHVIEPLPFPVSLTGILTVHDLIPNITTASREKVRTLLQTLDEEDLKAKVHVRDGYPASMIREVAADLGADLIVMATHGLTGWDRLFVGSVTTRVVRMAPCPVLVVRGQEAADEPPARPAQAEHADA